MLLNLFYPYTIMALFKCNCYVSLKLLTAYTLPVCVCAFCSAGVHDGGGRDVWRSADDGKRSLLERLQPQTPLHCCHSLCPPQTLLPGVNVRHGVSVWVLPSHARCARLVTVTLSV